MDEFENLEKQSLIPHDTRSKEETGADPWVIQPLEELITRMNFGLSSSLLYPAGHPVVNEAIEKMFQILVSLLKAYPIIMIRFEKEEIMYKGELLLESTFLARQLSGLFRERGIGSISFYPGIMVEEIKSWLYSFHENTDPQKVMIDKLSILLESKNVIHIRMDTIRDVNKQEKGSRYDNAKTMYTSGTQLIESVALSAISQRVVDVGQVRPLIQDLVDNLMKDNSAILAVSSLKSYDNYLFTHSMNVCILSLSLAIYLQIEPIRLMEIGIGAILHDIGKVFIPPEIIHKPGKLNDAEWKIMKQHPVDGLKMILRSRYAMELPALIIYCHHWKFASDEGYPQTRRKFARNPYVSLVSVCDCYDAMTTNRPYNRVHLPSDAKSIIKRMAGTELDPEIVYFFEKMLGQYPIGTLVKINTGEIAIVLQINPDEPMRPQVKIIIDQNGIKVDELILLDLSERDPYSAEYLNSIIETVDANTIPFNIWELL